MIMEKPGKISKICIEIDLVEGLVYLEKFFSWIAIISGFFEGSLG